MTYISDEDIEDLCDCLTEKERKVLEGRGFFLKMKKYFRDKSQAKRILREEKFREQKKIEDMKFEQFVKELREEYHTHQK